MGPMWVVGDVGDFRLALPRNFLVLTAPAGSAPIVGCNLVGIHARTDCLYGGPHESPHQPRTSPALWSPSGERCERPDKREGAWGPLSALREPDRRIGARSSSPDRD